MIDAIDTFTGKVYRKWGDKDNERYLMYDLVGGYYDELGELEEE
tara:strand:- start:61 stop:192 length:132 start_codon:yes stop_codon:yes gene_type:complete